MGGVVLLHSIVVELSGGRKAPREMEEREDGAANSIWDPFFLPLFCLAPFSTLLSPRSPGLIHTVCSRYMYTRT